MAWEWDPKRIRKVAWDTTFRRGWRAWFMLVVVGFVFAFIGASNVSQITFVHTLDQILDTSDVMQPQNTEILITYLDSTPFMESLSPDAYRVISGIANGLTQSATWAIRLLALNPRYFAANPGEVWINVVMAAMLTIAMRLFVQDVVVLGQYRFVMETRYAREVPWRRMLAPFHLHTLLNVFRVMVIYHVVLALWAPTIIGGIYKYFQYRMVPYLLAENPNIGWREARRLSKSMTDGYKWQMFLTELYWLPVMMLTAIPMAGLLVTVPLMSELESEFYFTLRANPAIDGSFFIERAFDAPAYVTLPEEERDALAAPIYLMEDLDVGERRRVVRGPLPYPVVDLIYCFFAFCFVGWVWEVGLHFFQAHEWVNRGTLYGPWIPIYGFGGVGIVALLDRYRETPVRLFWMAVTLCAVLEYACSWVLDFMFDASYWDYNDMLFNVNGRICLAGLLAFGLGGLLGVYVAAPAISRAVHKIPQRLRFAGAAVLVAAFCADFCYCLLNGFNGGEGVGEKLTADTAPDTSE